MLRGHEAGRLVADRYGSVDHLSDEVTQDSGMKEGEGMRYWH
jgi:hypothetical protein